MQQSRPATKSLIVPAATVFISSFCIMVLELVAGRIIARWLGSSLYTWTSVIGVVLAGITIGNYIGGRIADRFRAVRALAVLFAVSSGACILTIILNNFAGEWTWLWQFSWPVRIVMHVSLVFLLPSTLLGTISPVVAKMALERGLPTGRTVGDIYAWGAAGSIAGTFVAGYYLIAMMGTSKIVWLVAAGMMAMALFYGAKSILVWGGTAAVALALLLGLAPFEKAEKAGAALLLRARPDSTVVYEDETPYCYVAVKTLGGHPERRIFVQDTLVHSEMLAGNLESLQYPYEQVMAAVTRRFANGRDNLSFLIIGGGGYVLPRYLEHFWPQAQVDVAEIDPGVTRAAVEAFGLPADSNINTIAMDARNHVDYLIEQQRLGRETIKYDFIYEDALSNYSVPFQLTTREFNEKLVRIMKEDGIYMVELIDLLDSAMFLGSFVNTVKLSFPFVYIITDQDARAGRNTYVVIASQKSLNLEGVTEGFEINRNVWHFSKEDMAELERTSKGTILTDDYAPVENFLAPVAARDREQAMGRRREIKAREIASEAEEQAWAGNMPGTLKKLEELAQADPSVAIRSYFVMARIFADKNRITEALEIFSRAAGKFKDDPKDRVAELHQSYGALLQQIGREQDAAAQFSMAVEGYRLMLEKDPQSVNACVQLGNIFADSNDFDAAVAHFRKAVELQPDNADNNVTLMQALSMQGNIDEAIKVGERAVELLSAAGQMDAALNTRQYVEALRFRKSQLQPAK